MAVYPLSGVGPGPVCPGDGRLCYEDALLTLDSQNPAYTDQVTAKGYDTMTGIGTPNGLSFLLTMAFR